MLPIERFMAPAMSRVRIAPEAPTRAPATMRITFPTTKPAIATAVPVKALSSEITTGMSAPPIGRTIVTPKIRAPPGRRCRSVQDVGVVVEEPGAGQDQHDGAADRHDQRDGRKDPPARQDDRLALEPAHQLGRGDERSR
jgi:hypothetical protein